MDDNRGAVPIVMGFVDDVNALVTIEDAAEYLRLFEEIGGELGAILNTDKTRILTSTSGTSLVERMINSNNSDTQTRGQLLKKTIEKYSTYKGDPMEVTTGLRVLGVPIGNKNFCISFIQYMLKKSHHSHKFNSQQARKYTNNDATF